LGIEDRGLRIEVGRTMPLLKHVGEAVLDSGVLQEVGVPIRLGATPPRDVWERFRALRGG
jgi:hypothetical protein